MNDLQLDQARPATLPLASVWFNDDDQCGDDFDDDPDNGQSLREQEQLQLAKEVDCNGDTRNKLMSLCHQNSQNGVLRDRGPLYLWIGIFAGD